jgi:hypothetical protein
MCFAVLPLNWWNSTLPSSQSSLNSASPFVVHNVVKQGTVLGSILCGASTAEFGSDVTGYQIGIVNIKPPIFVDDIALIILDILDAVDGHFKAVAFGKKKKLDFGKRKCICLIINGKNKDVVPVLIIDGHVIEIKKVAKYQR